MIFCIKQRFVPHVPWCLCSFRELYQLQANFLSACAYQQTPNVSHSSKFTLPKLVYAIKGLRRRRQLQKNHPKFQWSKGIFVTVQDIINSFKSAAQLTLCLNDYQKRESTATFNDIYYEIKPPLTNFQSNFLQISMHGGFPLARFVDVAGVFRVWVSFRAFLFSWLRCDIKVMRIADTHYCYYQP